MAHRVSEARTAAGKRVRRKSVYYGFGFNAFCFLFSTIEERVDDAKASSSSWFSWGKAQSQEAADGLNRRASETQEAWNSRFEDAKKKAERKGEDVLQRAGETEEDFRRRIAKAIGPGRD